MDGLRIFLKIHKFRWKMLTFIRNYLSIFIITLVFEVIMKILKTLKLVLTWFWVYNTEVETGKLMKILHAFGGLSVFAIITSHAITSLLFFVEYISIDLEESLYALFQFVAFLGLVYVIVVVFSLRNRITTILTNLTEIYAESKLHNFY